MWYFAWILGLGFAVLLSILNALWLENEEGRREAFGWRSRLANTHGTDGTNANINQPKAPEDGTVTQGEPTQDVHKTGDTEDNEIA